LPHTRPGDSGEELAVVVVGQMRLEKAEHGQRDGTGLKERVDGRKPARQTGGFDATARFVLAEPELCHAVAKKGREALFHVKPARVHLAQVQDELCRHAPMRADDDVKFLEKCVVRAACESLHDQSLPW
jgi:hypothetical protein